MQARFLKPSYVLILVLMEDTLRVLLIILIITIMESLNPCFNGRYSQRRGSLVG